MKKGLRRSDIVPLILLCLTWFVILITWGVNALPREKPSVTKLDVGKLKREIQEAGLEPREARHYRILPEDQEQK